MKEPPYGLCYPCSIERVIDGDTIVVRVFGYELNVRLLDCWAPESRGKEKDAGLASKAALSDRISAANRYSFFLPASHGSLAEVITLGRVLGRVFLDGEDASEFMVANGYATAKKNQRRGE